MNNKNFPSMHPSEKNDRPEDRKETANQLPDEALNERFPASGFVEIDITKVTEKGKNRLNK